MARKAVTAQLTEKIIKCYKARSARRLHVQRISHVINGSARMRLGSACWQSSRFNRAHYSIPRVQKLCESRGSRPGLPSTIVRTVSVDNQVKQH